MIDALWGYRAAGAAFDEGRAMLQIAHDVAPAARLCFATADTGELGFAANIRALGDPKGTCRADTEADDVFYFDEPFFSDGPIAQAVDDVAKQGVSYFSSAGNQGDPSAWAADVHLVPASRAAGSGLDFSQVPTELYNGGFQDMKPGRGIDISQTLTVASGGGIFDLQWNDPVDVNGATLGDPYYTASGALTTPTSAPTFAFTPTSSQLGHLAQFRIDGVPSGSVDLILDVIKPDGTDLGPIDTGSSPEIATTTLDEAGTYTIKVTGFNGATGSFTVDVRPILAPSKTTTDFNVLLFGPDGSYFGALGDDNRLTGQPSEIAGVGGLGDVQMVIAKGGTEPTKVTKLRYIVNGDIYQREYENPLAPAIFGHSVASGATSVAAFDPFKPYLPEFFSSIWIPSRTFLAPARPRRMRRQSQRCCSNIRVDVTRSRRTRCGGGSSNRPSYTTSTRTTRKEAAVGSRSPRTAHRVMSTTSSPRRR